MTNYKDHNLIAFFVTVCFCLLTVATAVGQRASPTPVDAVQTVSINKVPLRNFAGEFQRAVAAGDADFDSPFLIEVKGVIGDDGKFVSRSVKVNRTEGNKEVVEIVLKGISSVNDSGFLSYLKNLSITDVVVLVQQNDTTFSTRIAGPVKDESHAKTAASGINTLVKASDAILKNRNLTERDKLEFSVLKTVKSEAQGKTLVLSSEMTKSAFRELMLAQSNILK